MSTQWETKVAEVQQRQDAFNALPAEVQDLLASLRARWAVSPKLISQYECVRDECLKIWGSN